MRTAAVTLADSQDHASLWLSFRKQPGGPFRSILFETYLPLSRRVAASIKRDRGGADLDLDDLRQYAAEGLLQAIDRFEMDRGVPFEAFALRRIRGCIWDGIAETSELRRQVAFRQRVRSERARSLAAENAGTMSSNEAMTALADLAVALALGFILDDLGTGPAPETRSREPNGYESLAWSETVARVANAVDALPDQEQRVVRLHYLEGLEFIRISSVMGLTKGRVSQIHSSALQRLKKRLPRPDHLETHRQSQ